MDAILSARGLRFMDKIAYPPIDIERNRVTFLLGESGSGKSTLLKICNATVSPSAGTVFYKGRDIALMDSVVLRREVLLVSQNVFLFDGTIADNFVQYYTYREKIPPSKEEMKQYLSLCCAQEDVSVRCETMSGGERQRVFTAVFLSFLPEVLMLDEPTSALDEKTAGRFFENLKPFCHDHQKTLLVISHDKELAERYADRKIVLEKGEVQ